VLEACGCALAGASPDIAPADKKIYALRDVTGTVESPALICASIMSKKLAEGIDALVLDVKTGSGAFMKTMEEAEHLATLLVETGESMGKRVTALITDMNQPLGRTAGNAMEVAEALDVLDGGGPDDLRELCIELAAWMFYLGERASDVNEGKKLAGELLATGKAREKFREIVRLQGGDVGAIDQPQKLPRARQTCDVLSPSEGYLAGTQCEQLGRACVVLGGGREEKDDFIDPGVGLRFHKRIGDRVARGEPLCTIRYNSAARLEQARQLVETAYQIEPAMPGRGAQPPVTIPPLIHKTIGSACA
jgi:pyrimidine-nucleoside phosphorylase